MRITIITINYNSSENTIQLLESLKKQTDPAQSNSADHQSDKGRTLSGASKDFEIIVVDNDSDDVGKLMNYQTAETNIIYIKNDNNLGFSGGNNVGIKKALENGTDWVLLLNNDTWVESPFIAQLKANLDSSAGSEQGDKEGIIGLAIDEGDRIAFAGKIGWLKPTLPHINNAKAISNFQFPISNEFSNPNSSNGKRKMVNDKCFYAIGGAMLIHKDVFDRIGLLDEKYFLYFEDADFCQRARKAGIPVSFFPEIKIAHSVSSSTKKLGSPMLLRYHYRNALYFNLKNGSWYIKLLVWPWSWIIILKQIIKITIGQKREQSLAILRGVGDWYSNKMGKLHD